MAAFQLCVILNLISVGLAIPTSTDVEIVDCSKIACSSALSAQKIPREDADLFCCFVNGRFVCCKTTNNDIHRILTEVDENITASNSKKDGNPEMDNQDHGVNILSLSIGTTIGIVIGIALLLIGCGISFHYCCKSPDNNGYVQTLQERQALVYLPPAGNTSSRNSSGVRITVTSYAISTLDKSPQLKPVADEPPNYDEINEVSKPSTSAVSQNLSEDNSLPSYHEAANI